MELQRALSFVCCGCGQGLDVVVHCSGKGLTDRTRPVAAVHVACPLCGQVNEVLFEPKGLIQVVRPAAALRSVPLPSNN